MGWIMKKCGNCSEETDLNICWRCWTQDRPIPCDNWEDCPTFHDGCNCSTDVIRNVIKRTDRYEVLLKRVLESQALIFEPELEKDIRRILF